MIAFKLLIAASFTACSLISVATPTIACDNFGGGEVKSFEQWRYSTYKTTTSDGKTQTRPQWIVTEYNLSGEPSAPPTVIRPSGPNAPIPHIREFHGSSSSSVDSVKTDSESSVTAANDNFSKPDSGFQPPVTDRKRIAQKLSNH
ncbi:MAG TPA: hypothetical protein V6C76_10855 [Drouetiella sp.]